MLKFLFIFIYFYFILFIQKYKFSEGKWRIWWKIWEYTSFVEMESSKSINLFNKHVWKWPTYYGNHPTNKGFRMLTWWKIHLNVKEIHMNKDIYLWRKVVCLFCFVCLFQTITLIATLLELLEIPWWIEVHWVGFIMFPHIVEKLLIIEYFFHWQFI